MSAVTATPTAYWEGINAGHETSATPTINHHTKRLACLHPADKKDNRVNAAIKCRPSDRKARMDGRAACSA